eukprot:c23245_g1_i1 orf=154-2130(+)
MIRDQRLEPKVGSKPSLEKPWKQKRKLGQSGQVFEEVEIFEGKPVAPSPSFLESTSAEDGYIRIICMDESNFLVPRKVVDSFKCIDVILHSEVSFKERLENVIRFPDMSSQVMETVLRFVFIDHLNKLKAEKYWGSQTPRLVFQFEVPPTQVMDIIHAAHFLGVQHLLSVAAAMVAHNLKDLQELSSLPPDLAWCIAEQLSAQDLFLAEERPDFVALNLDTETLWEKHCKNQLQEDIVPIADASAYPPYNVWDVNHGPPPTSWKSLYIATYLQQLADRQNGGDTERFIMEVSEKGQHAHCHSVRPIFWEWVVQGDANFFVTYISCFKNILKLSLSKLPLGKLSQSVGFSSSKLGILLDSLPLLQFLDVSDAGIGAEAAVSLSMGLKQHKRIQVLCLGHNNIETLGFSALVRALPCTRTLKVLDARENGIGAWVVLEVVEALTEAALEDLILEGNFKFINKLVRSSVPPISPVTSCMHEELDEFGEFSNFEVSMKDLIMSGLPKALKSLQYAKCELDDVRIKVLVKSLSCLSWIQKLDLSGNKITSEGATSVFLWLQENETLLELNLSNNYITDSCSTTLSRVISNHSSLEKLSLMENYSYGESNLHEVLTAATDRGMKLQSAYSRNFTLDLRRTEIAHLTQARIQRQRGFYTYVNLLL